MGGPLSVVKVFTQIWTFHVHSLLLLFSANFVGYSYDDHFNPHGFLWFSPISGDTFQTIPIIISSIPLLLIIIIIIVIIIIIITIIIITGLSCSPIKTGFEFRHRATEAPCWVDMEVICQYGENSPWPATRNGSYLWCFRWWFNGIYTWLFLV